MCRAGSSILHPCAILTYGTLACRLGALHGVNFAGVPMTQHDLDPQDFALTAATRLKGIAAEITSVASNPRVKELAAELVHTIEAELLRLTLYTASTRRDNTIAIVDASILFEEEVKLLRADFRKLADLVKVLSDKQHVLSNQVQAISFKLDELAEFILTLPYDNSTPNNTVDTANSGEGLVDPYATNDTRT